MISVSNLAKSFGPQTLFEGVSFQLNPGERYGLVGANGSGKSTLLRILAGEEMPTDGTVAIPKRLRLGVLRQDRFEHDDQPILDVVLMGHPELWEAWKAREELLAQADESFDADRFSELEEIVQAHDGYTSEALAGEVLEGLGIPTEVHRDPLSNLSGGFKLRVLLAQVLASRPGALLLDEPTNHLDIVSIRWLEKFLQTYPGIVVVISHDHRFLDNVCNQILDVDYETVLLYPGNYADFVEAKQEERGRKEREIRKREQSIAHHKAFVERFRAKATKARQAKSKQKLIDKIVIEPLPQSSRRYPTFRFQQRRPSGKQVLEIEGISKAFGDKRVLDNVSIAVQRGDRLAVLGPNGIGKSTLLKIAVGSLEADGGRVEWGYETHPGYFPQDHRRLLVPERMTVESWLWEAAPAETIGFIRNRLGLALFSGDEAEKRVGSLSGGEAARLIFSRLSIEQPNVLVLDEPTNHLDLEAIEALVVALHKYDGTLIFVSHDRWFVSQLADRILEISPAGIRDYRGTYDEYVEFCGDDHLDVEQVLLRVKREKRGERSRQETDPEARKQVRDLTRRRDRLAEEIDRAENRIGEINETFCDPTYFERTPAKEARKLEAEQKQLAARLEECLAEWEEAEEELAKVDGSP
jgi:ATPase subunit of ABC transporter with duplicated ATPase domains